MTKTTRRLGWAFVAIVGVGLAATVYFDVFSRYDRASPDYRYVMARLSAAKPASIEPKSINNGDWQILCVIGAYNDPVNILRNEATARNVQVNSIEPAATQSFGISPIEENEGAISFIDGGGRGRTVLIDGFERIARQHVYRCFSHDTGPINLPIE